MRRLAGERERSVKEGEGKREREREAADYRIGKRDTVVGRFGQGCWQGEPGLYLQIKHTGALAIDTGA